VRRLKKVIGAAGMAVIHIASCQENATRTKLATKLIRGIVAAPFQPEKYDRT